MKKFKLDGLMLTTPASHPLMLHLGGDNYLDRPGLAGVGGVHVACGLISP